MGAESPPRPESAPVVLAGCDVLVRPGDLRPAAGLVIEGGRVAEVGVTAAPAGATTIDARGMLAMPGLVNAHTHSPENCLRGAGQRLPLEPWLLLLFEVGGLYDAHAHRICALAGAAEMLRTGTTSVIDHLWMAPPSLESIDAAMGAYRDAGIRAAVAPLMSDEDTTPALSEALGIDISSVRIPVKPRDELLALLDEAMAHWHGSEDGRLQVFAGPGGLQWCSDELMSGAGDLAARHGTGFHTHVLETSLQDAVCRHRFGCSGVEALDRLGVLGPRTSLPHSVWITPADVELIASRDAVVVHNPAANTRLGSGRAPVPALIEAGAAVALGADGSASSDNQVMWDEVKLAALIHNDGLSDVWIDGAQALTMATTSGAAALGHRDDGLGTLAPGAPADIALLDRFGPTLAGSLDLEGTLALSENGSSVRHVWVAGQQVVRDGVCLTIDEDAVLRELAELASERVGRHQAPPDDVRAGMGQIRALRGAATSCA